MDKDKEQNYKDIKDVDFWFTEYATIEGYFLARLKGKNCESKIITQIKEKILTQNTGKQKLKHMDRIYKAPEFDSIDKLDACIDFVLKVTSEESKFNDSGAGAVLKKIYEYVKNELKIQGDPDHIDCPSLTKKIKELLGKSS